MPSYYGHLFSAVGIERRWVALLSTNTVVVKSEINLGDTGMNFNIVRSGLLAVVIAVLASSDSFGQFGRRVEADPNADIRLTDQHGPWLILCASFDVGEVGLRKAHELALELRRTEGIETYLYRHQFNITGSHAAGSFTGDKWERYKKTSGEWSIRPVRMKLARESDFEQVAVVAGHFGALDDNAKKVLEKIKSMHPESLEFDRETRDAQRLADVREYLRVTSRDARVQGQGPMRLAFLMPNPLLPDEYFRSQKRSTNF